MSDQTQRAREAAREIAYKYNVADETNRSFAEEAITAIILRALSEHRCPHFKPKGEDSGGAYNAGIIADVTDDLLNSSERDHLNAKPRTWYSSLIKQLIQRIANLRVMLTEARALNGSTPDIFLEFHSRVANIIRTSRSHVDDAYNTALDDVTRIMRDLEAVSVTSSALNGSEQGPLCEACTRPIVTSDDYYAVHVRCAPEPVEQGVSGREGGDVAVMLFDLESMLQSDLFAEASAEGKLLLAIADWIQRMRTKGPSADIVKHLAPAPDTRTRGIFDAGFGSAVDTEDVKADAEFEYHHDK